MTTNRRRKACIGAACATVLAMAVLATWSLAPTKAGSRRQDQTQSLTGTTATPSAIPAGQDGSAAPGTAPTTGSAGFTAGEDLSKAALEATPTAPDDTVGSAGAIGLPIRLPGGLDHAAAGVGTRNAGFGSIRMRGIPQGCVAVRAFLYWGTIISTPIALTQTITFNGASVTGHLLGTCKPPCWPGNVFVVYKASVIGHLTAVINGDYAVGGLPSSVTNGRSPWFAPTPAPLSEGSSLVVVYSDPNVPFASRVYLHDSGPVLVNGFSTVTINNALAPALPAYTAIKHTRLGADGQVGQDTFASHSYTGEITTLETTQIRGPGAGSPDTDSDWNGHDGGPLNQLWDTNTDSSFDVTILNVGAVSYKVVYQTQSDCFVVVAHVLTAK